MKFALSLSFVIFWTTVSFAQAWELVGDVPFHKHHSNAFGYNGKAYLFEGVYKNDGAANVSNEVWEYTPETNSWKRLKDFPGPARGIAIGEEMDGKYYYGFGSEGGPDGLLNDLWVFDPRDTSFVQLPDCPCEGRTHPALVAHKNKIYVGSGSTWFGDFNDWWVLDLSTMQWSEKDVTTLLSRHHTFQFGIGDHIYVGGGHLPIWEAYNVITESWEAIDDTPKSRVAGTQFSYGGKGFVLGGDNTSHVHVNAEKSFMMYDPATDSWQNLDTLPNGSRWAPTSFIINDEIYFLGGLDNDDLQDSTMWKFDLSKLQLSSSINQSSYKEELTLYPNPSSTVFQINGKSNSKHGYNLKILDPTGKVVIQIRDYNFSDYVNIAPLPPGMYTVQMTSQHTNRSFLVVRD